MRNLTLNLTDALLVCLFSMLRQKACRQKLPCFSARKNKPRQSLTEVIGSCFNTLPGDEKLRDELRQRLAFCLFAARHLRDYNAFSLDQLYHAALWGHPFFPEIQDEWLLWQQLCPALYNNPITIISRLGVRDYALRRDVWKFCLEILFETELNPLNLAVIKLLKCGCQSAKLVLSPGDTWSFVVRYLPSDEPLVFKPA